MALLLLLASLVVHADPAIARGFDHYYNLEYDQALTEFRAALARDPTSPDRHNYVALTLLFREMYRNGALESELVSGNNAFLRRPKMNPPPDVEKAFLDELAASMRLANERLQKNPNDTAAMYALGIAYGLRSNYYFLVKKAWRDSLRDATSARKLHNRVSELVPSDIDARLVQGLHDYIVGSLPLAYRMLGFIIGFHGDRDRGIRTVLEVAQKGDRNKVDAEVFLCALYRRENKPRSAIPLLQDLLRRFPRNHLLRFELANMYSAIGDKTDALAEIQEVAAMKRRGLPGYATVPWEKIWFQEGNIEFWYRDFDRALENLKKVTAAAQELDLNTGVLAWLRLGQTYDLTNRRQLAIDAYNRTVAFAPQADAAREARRYLSSPYRR